MPYTGTSPGLKYLNIKLSEYFSFDDEFLKNPQAYLTSIAYISGP